MTERVFGRLDAVRRSAAELLRCGGQIIKGEAVIVPIDRDLYANRVERLAHADPEGWGSYANIAETALKRAPLSIGDSASFEEFHQLPEGSTLRHWQAGEQQLPEVSA